MSETGWMRILIVDDEVSLAGNDTETEIDLSTDFEVTQVDVNND